MPTRAGRSRGVGVVLLTALVVVAVATFGAFYLGSLDSGGEALATLDVRLEPADGGDVAVTVTHGGGQSLATTETVVVLRDDAGNEARPALADGTLSGASPETFDAGETWTWVWDSTESYAVGERLRVLVVHEGTGSVPFDSPVTVSEPEIATLAPKYEPPAPGEGRGGDGGAGDGGDGGDPGVRDPGFAYLDHDRDHRYESDTQDTRVDLADNDNGDVRYAAPSGPLLVIPGSVSGGELRARNGRVRLEADGVDVDVSLTSTTSAVEVIARSGPVYVGPGDTLYGRNGAVTVDADGDVFADGATFESDTSAVSLTGVAMSLRDTTVDARNGPITVDAGDDVDAGGATFESATSRVEVSGTTIDLTAATVRSDNNAVRIDASGDVLADDATLESGTSAVEVSGETVRLRDASVTSDNDAVTVDAGGAIDASGTTTFRSSSTLSLMGASIDVHEASLESTNRGLTLTATSGDVDIRNADLSTASQWQDAVADVTGGGTVRLDGFTLTGDDRLDVRPDDAYTPQTGEYAGDVE
ncbi:type IV pilin [Salinigranum sp. GCM10025319]|uniref:type IV pilin n=1 Tax=Salinigranum sp. GCM10025319 TaxID=3252687 RepID=UPI00360F2834